MVAIEFGKSNYDDPEYIVKNGDVVILNSTHGTTEVCLLVSTHGKLQLVNLWNVNKSNLFDCHTPFDFPKRLPARNFADILKYGKPTGDTLKSIYIYPHEQINFKIELNNYVAEIVY
jgi:hypothetical protein